LSVNFGLSWRVALQALFYFFSFACAFGKNKNVLANAVATFCHSPKVKALKYFMF